MEPAEDVLPLPRGAASFCVPRAAVEALLAAQAGAYEICAYLVLACFTDASGLYSSASLAAVARYTGANKTRSGPLAQAIDNLQRIRVHSYPAQGQPVDRGPLLYDRAAWLEQAGAEPPDGPVQRARVQFVLPDFGEPRAQRVWFGAALVSGVRGFSRPLRALKNAGDWPARLLLLLYAAHDLRTWCGVPPLRGNPWANYEPADEDRRLAGGARLLRRRRDGQVAHVDRRVGPRPEDYWQALEALEAAGFVYEVVMALNRDARPAQSAEGGRYGQVPDDAEPLYELDCRSLHGYKPRGEEGIAWATARTAGECGASVADADGRFDKTYAAILPAGHPGMVAGVYRLRFRPSNFRNDGVAEAWTRMHQGNQDGLDLVNRVRRAHGLEPLALPNPTGRGAPD